MITGKFRGFELELHDPGVAVITMNQPDRLNGTTQPMKRDMVEVLMEAQMDDAVRVIVITGSGRAFCAGYNFGGGFSHGDEQNRYALDFAADIGTVVVAARAGTVMQVESDFSKAGLVQEKYGGRANFVRILHDDGTMALYAHLATNGVHVRVGQRVSAGQQIGLSGNTGFTTGPHLHFAVQANRGMRLMSIPFRMRGVAMPKR